MFSKFFSMPESITIEEEYLKRIRILRPSGKYVNLDDYIALKLEEILERLLREE